MLREPLESSSGSPKSRGGEFWVAVKELYSEIYTQNPISEYFTNKFFLSNKLRGAQNFGSLK